MEDQGESVDPSLVGQVEQPRLPPSSESESSPRVSSSLDSTLGDSSNGNFRTGTEVGSKSGALKHEEALADP